MEIQQHDGVVVEVAAISVGLRQAQREGKVVRREREAPETWCACPPFPPLYIGPLGGVAALGDGISKGAAAKGDLPPKPSGGAPTPRVSNPRRRGGPRGRTSPLGAGSPPTSAHGALRDRWPHPVDPRDPFRWSRYNTDYPRNFPDGRNWISYI